MVFLTRIFWNMDLGIEWVLRCKAMELESLRCIVNCLEGVVVVRPTYALFSLETLSSKEHLNIYMMLVLSRSSLEGEVLLEIIRLEVIYIYIYIYTHTHIYVEWYSSLLIDILRKLFASFFNGQVYIAKEFHIKTLK